MLPALLIAAAAVAHAAVVPPHAPEVLFEFDSSALPANTDARLAPTVAFARAHPRARVVLDAYCDPIGTAPYNIGLAIRRVEDLCLEQQRDDPRAASVPQATAEAVVRPADRQSVTYGETV